MKTLSYVLIAVFICNVLSLEAKYVNKRSRRSSCNQKMAFNWWPQRTYQNTQNNISCTIKPFSQEETCQLFLDKGKSLIAQQGWFFINQPILPLHITIINNNNFPIMIGETNINLGTNWIGIKRKPINLTNILESLSNKFFWSSPLEVERASVHDWTGKIIGTTSNYIKNTDPLINCSFLELDEFNLSSLYNLEPSILFGLGRNSMIIEAGKTKEFLIFVWAKEIKLGLNISIAHTTFTTNLA